MGNYEQLKQSVSDVIKTNGNQEITGSILQNVLLTIISTVGANATFAGIATPATNPGAPDGPVFYLASESGTYTNFNAIELQDELSVLMWNDSWSSQQLFSIDDVPTVESNNLVKSGGVFNNIGAIDISELNATENPHTLATYEDLTAALNALPASYRKGGTSVKFVKSPDNKYVQYMYVSTSTAVADFTNVGNWEKTNLEKEVIDIKQYLDYSSVGYRKRNGSQGNPSNSWVITLYGKATNAIPVTEGREVKISVSKALPEGFNYYYRVITYNTNNPANINNDDPSRVRDLTIYTYSIEKPFKINTGEKGLTIQLTALASESSAQTEGECVALRVADFNNNDINIEVGTWTIEKLHETDVNLENGIIETRIKERYTKGVKRGSVGNPGNQYAVRSCGLDVRGIKKIQIVTDRPVSEGCHYAYSVKGTSSDDAIGEFFTMSSGYPIIQEGDNLLTGELVLNEGVKCIAITLYEVKDSDSSQVVIDLADFNTYKLYIQGIDTGVYALNEKVNTLSEHVNTISNGLNERVNILEGYNLSSELANGGIGNAYNAYKVRTACIDIRNIKKFKVYTNRPKDEHSNYYVEALFTSSTSAIGNLYAENFNPGGYVKVSDVQNKTIDFVFDKPEGAVAVAFGIYEVPDSGYGSVGDIVLRKGDFESYELGLFNIINENYLQEEIDEINATVKDDIYNRNKDKLVELSASCRYRKSSNTSKDFQMLIVTDSHDDNVCVNNGVVATNNFELIDAFIHCGDISDHIYVTQNTNSLWKNIIVNCTKPYYYVIGNHEAGTYININASPTQEQLYNNFIKPIVDAGHLANGEYTVGKCYYYHDFESHNVRLIVVNEYETPRIPDTTAYWKPITYNGSLPNCAENTEYKIGTQANVNGYTDYSFEAVSDFNSGNFYSEKHPAVKYRLGYRWISQTQAQWFLDTLASTPSGYKIVVACHNPFSKRADVLQTVKFSQKNGWTNGYGMQNYMTNDFIADAINAYQTKSNFTTTCSSQYPDDMPSYNVSKDFSNVVGVFHSLLGGHVHQDCVWKHQTYNQYQVTPICTNSNAYHQCPTADIRRTSSSVVNELDTDCLTVVSFRPEQLGLVKIGVNVTETGEKRDYEVITISGN